MADAADAGAGRNSWCRVSYDLVTSIDTDQHPSGYNMIQVM